MNNIEDLLKDTNSLLQQISTYLVPQKITPDWHFDAFRWRVNAQQGFLEAVAHPHRVALEDLLCLDRQKAEVVRNTLQFIQGKEANNILLWGSRGTGKSTLIKAIFNEYMNKGLRLIEIQKEHLIDLPNIIDQLYDRPEKFILFCDDLSFEADDPGYKSLKAILEGSICAPPRNVLIYASSNRRHLLPESKKDNQDVHIVEGEIHPGETIEEKISLSERFGLWLSFHPFNQDQYLEIVEHWLAKLEVGSIQDENTRLEALRWARERGSRSGRVARQYAVDKISRT